MTESATLGTRIRDRRLALGLSLGQLATKVGRTAASVRAWERGQEVPDPKLLVELAGVLDLDPGELEALAVRVTASEPEKPPAPTPPAVTKETPSAVGSGDGSGSRVASASPPPAATGTPPPASTVPAASSDERSTMVPPSDAFVRFEETRPVSIPPAAAAIQSGAQAGGPSRVSAGDLLEAPTEAIEAPVPPVPAATATRPAPYVEQDGEAEDGRTGFANPFTLLLDPERRWIYWIRATLTVVVLIVFLVVLAWAVGQLWDALGQVLDSFGDATEGTTTTLP